MNVKTLVCMIKPNHSEITVKSLREGALLTQEELGRRLNLSFRTVSDWETGKKIPRFDNAVILAKELGVSLKTLARAFKMDVDGLPDDD